MTVTDMVRCRSTVEQTRVLVVDYMSSVDEVDDDDDDEQDGANTATETETDAETDTGASSRGMWTEDDDRLNMDVARVYEKTIVQLGERLGDVWGAVGTPSAPRPDANPTCG